MRNKNIFQEYYKLRKIIKYKERKEFEEYNNKILLFMVGFPFLSMSYIHYNTS